MKKFWITIIVLGVALFVYRSVVVINENGWLWAREPTPTATPTITMTPTPTEKPRINYTVLEQEMYNGNGLVIKVLGSSRDADGYTRIRYEYDNATGKVLNVYNMAYAINGIMVSSGPSGTSTLNMPVSVGKVNNIYRIPTTGYLTQLGETKVRSIESLVFVYEYTTGGFGDHLFTINPGKISTTDDDGMRTDPKGERIYEKDGIAVEIRHMGGDTYDLFFLNQTDMYERCTMEATLNGETAFVHLFEDEYILSGCWGHQRITLKENDVLSFRLYVKTEGKYHPWFYTDTIEYKATK
ncbi:MAG: hypothetical protein J6Y10_00540 [Lachnospiraceae bacterium]|nr:hypothetical protein [Lachnospiraceae bacterium]